MPPCLLLHRALEQPPIDYSRVARRAVGGVGPPPAETDLSTISWDLRPPHRPSRSLAGPRLRVRAEGGQERFGDAADEPRARFLERLAVDLALAVKEIDQLGLAVRNGDLNVDQMLL